MGVTGLAVLMTTFMFAGRHKLNLFHHPKIDEHPYS